MNKSKEDIENKIIEKEEKEKKELERLQNQWLGIVAEMKAIANIQDPLLRNEKISLAYLELYESNPKLLWALTAFYASKQVGCGIKHATDLPFLGNLAANLLGEGNKNVFLDIYSMLKYYNQHGLDNLKRIVPKPKTNEQAIIDALQEIDKGNIDSGADIMLYHEQKDILQPMYDDPKFGQLVNLNHKLCKLSKSEKEISDKLYDSETAPINPGALYGAALHGLFGEYTRQLSQPEQVSLTAYCSGGLEHDMSDIDFRNFNQRITSARKLVSLLRELISKNAIDIASEKQNFIDRTTPMKKAC